MSQNKKTLLTVVGARPQWMKAAALSRVLARPESLLSERILHTGQHHSHDMSGAFFEELNLPKADHMLRVSDEPGTRMGQMMQGISDAIAQNRPDAVVLYGDTDSTLAGAWAATRCGIPVVHIEAGLRSFDRAMPEEVNRILTDQLSSLLFCPSEAAVEQLRKEGLFTQCRPGVRVEVSGDLMLDTARYYGGQPAPVPSDAKRVLLTLHRPSNVDRAEVLSAWIDAVEHAARQRNWTVIFPVHPRTAKNVKRIFGEDWERVLNLRGIEVHQPAGYMQMLDWLKTVACVWTDSGGLQKEAFFMHRQAVVLRTTTEWTELLEGGFTSLCPEPGGLEEAMHALHDPNTLHWNAPIYGDGQAAEIIAQTLYEWLSA